jgi:hypothetical protein
MSLRNVGPTPQPHIPEDQNAQNTKVPKPKLSNNQLSQSFPTFRAFLPLPWMPSSNRCVTGNALRYRISWIFPYHSVWIGKTSFPAEENLLLHRL